MPHTDIPASIMDMDQKQKLTFVLLCSGNGADSSIYRPKGDDKRYRHRLDALVRCVAVTLFSAAGASTAGSCELILLFDGDLSYMEMKLSSGSGEERQAPILFTQQPPPLERDIVMVWKNAINEASRRQKLNTSSSIGSLGSSFNRIQNEFINGSLLQLETKCVFGSGREEMTIKSPPRIHAEASNYSFTQSKQLPSHMPNSKRDAISMLQSTCSLEFLRSHHLNVPLDVALKKINKNKLQAIWDNASKKDNGNQQPAGRFEWTFRKILSKAKGEKDNDSKNDYSTDVLAAYLHESCDSELPCWSNDLCRTRNKGVVKNIFLFCGAVRDMTDAEHDSLSNVCTQMNIPLLPCRLGPIPEFTSKIISVAGYHHYKGLLGHGLIQLWEKKQKQAQEMPTATQLSRNNISHMRSLHTIAIIPIDSSSLTADPNKRCRVHWCMVRLCVCSLYRSKFASAKSTVNSRIEAIENKLSLIFNDGRTITLSQQDFIASLAEKHQAAPSERQILEELCRRRDEAMLQESKDDVNRLITSYTPKNGYHGAAYALDFTQGVELCQRHLISKQVMELAYSRDCPSENPTANCESTLLAILQVRDQSGDNTKLDRSHKIVLDAILRANIQVRTQSLLVSEAQDGEALTVIMLQHLDYQAKLFGILGHVFETRTTDVAIASETDRRKRKMNQMKEKKKKSKKRHKHPKNT